MTIKTVRHFLIGIASVLFIGGVVRLYRLLRSHADDSFFVLHLLVTALSLLISWNVLKVGRQTHEMTRKEAISLIRSGSVLMMIWGYRLYLLTFAASQTRETGSLELAMGLGVSYFILGTGVMCIGLWINRSQVPKQH